MNLSNGFWNWCKNKIFFVAFSVIHSLHIRFWDNSRCTPFVVSSCIQGQVASASSTRVSFHYHGSAACIRLGARPSSPSQI